VGLFKSVTMFTQFNSILTKTAGTNCSLSLGTRLSLDTRAVLTIRGSWTQVALNNGIFFWFLVKPAVDEFC
jgi:hypothetical protein